MKKDQVYAVVDIESTGGSIGKGERMIQFACVLVRNGEIIERFDTFVNPMKSVPKRIQELTGIQPSDLSRAPLFDDLAEFIRDLLDDTIFVAHNVSFDFSFLNEELQQAGLRPLTIPAIDTVELAQILFPTADSFNLQELVEWLGYELDQPHHALFDAEATAFLLKELSKKVESLPLVTLEKVVELAEYCTAETATFFTHALDKLKADPGDLNDQLVVANGLALKNPVLEESYSYRENKQYPYQTEDKAEMFSEKFMIRHDQEEMMNAIYNYMRNVDATKELAVEAAPGSGKTFGYLFPATFVASPSDRVVISTHTTVLQKQIMEETIPFLRENSAFDFSVALIKSRRHYLSLDTFEQRLKKVKTDQLEAMFCMRVLVWLTETDTGDLEELGTGGHNHHTFWEDVRSKKGTTDKKASNWGDFDFYVRAQKRIEHASILVTNHAFLAHDWKKEESLLPDFDRLVIDEAHHFPDVLQEASTEQVSSFQIKALLKQLGEQGQEGSLIYKLTKFIPRQLVKKYQLDSLEANAQLLEEEWQGFVTTWIADLEIQADASVLKWIDEEIVIENQSLNQKKRIKQVRTQLNELLFLGHQLLESLLKEEKALSIEEKLFLDDLYDWLEQLDTIKDSIKEIFLNQHSAQLHWVSYYTKSPETSLRFQSLSGVSQTKLTQSVHELSHVVYTSSTLSIDGDLRYFKRLMQTEEMDFLSLSTPYNYQQQAKILAPNDLPKGVKYGTDEYIRSLADAVENLTVESKQNTLILFRSLEVLQSVHKELLKRDSLHGRTILSQNVSGTRSKLIKQFRKADRAILLGADSFWEGVDLPGEALRVVIVTRLPFDSPDRPLTKLRHRTLEQAGENPFMMDLLPKAVLKMKQGFGRLIRSENDKGIFIVLDERFTDSSYGKVFQDSLPKGTTIDRFSTSETLQTIKEFF